MSAITRKDGDLYVGTDKHWWWKEAVVYQVFIFVFTSQNEADA